MFTALLDANVLVPVSLTDTLLRCAEKGLYLPRWSKTILDECMRAILRVHPQITVNRLQARFSAMEQRFPDARVQGFEPLISSISLPDPDDRHVVAAAWLGNVDVIVTRNIEDFPKLTLQNWGLEVVSPDCFLRDMLDLYPDQVMTVMSEQSRDTRRPPRSLSDILVSLERAGVPGFVADVRGKESLSFGR